MFRWWIPGIAVAASAVTLLTHAVVSDVDARVGSVGWVALTAVLHLPLLLILVFLAVGMVERLGYFWRGRAPAAPGRLPARLPTVCVQLPMFNEHAVARRAIEAAAALRWPADRFSIQVLDDSTDADTRAIIEAICARLRAAGVDCTVLHRVERRGYKAGALEAGRLRTDAEFLVVFDADFVPSRDYLLRVMPHFYRSDGSPDHRLALVQAQWAISTTTSRR